MKNPALCIATFLTFFLLTIAGGLAFAQEEIVTYEPDGTIKVCTEVIPGVYQCQ